METKNMICINCPMGCMLKVTKDKDNYKVQGNTCKRGAEYGISEMTNPKRIITSSVFIKGGVHPITSVKTSCAIPKNLIFDCMKQLVYTNVEAPVKIGDVIVKNVLNTGADIVATRNVDQL